MGCRGFCAVFLIDYFIAIYCGAKKSGVLLFRKFENMGGVYAAVYMPFRVVQEMGCVRISSPFPDHARQDAGHGWGYAFVIIAMFSLLRSWIFLSHTFEVIFLVGD